MTESGLMWAVGARRVLITGAAAAVCAATGQAFAHAAYIQLSPARGVEVRAAYDSGEPMVSAQVRIYAPDAPARVWLQGLTDESGVYRFVPDPAIDGAWAVQVRQAGHGAMGEIRLEPTSVPAAEAALPLSTSATGPDPLQKALMAAAIIWGFIGTALYFKRPR
ncbi:hypothetical protein [Azoarcus taiwanensis]|nr:hypothetical protein [Azoarcus taiwanensis]